ncbi:MAG: adenylate/guanylate cyclase domain-containing protein [Gammaproteobacteria bacterium]|nr:adenylate/guanylate cyclase domain-containing protein [Gammaproteobacteria bacterium]
MTFLVPQILVAMVALGMGLAFVVADRDSPTSRAVATALAALGLAVVLNIGFLRQEPGGPTLSGWLALPEGLSIAAFLEWLLRVRRTVPSRELNVSGGDHILRLGQAASLAYVLLSILYPELRSRDFLFAVSSPRAFARPGFWLFAVPVLFASLTGLASAILLLNRRPDRPERIRVLAMLGAVPFLTAGFVLPAQWSAISVTIGEMVFLVGSIRYHVLQGRRGQFMSRFLSAQVAELVRSRGLKALMQHQQLEITVVACDLRGFTNYAAALPSVRVIEVLRDYYDAVGQVVAAHEGTIKDYAGDGILILVGAPIPVADHARRGLALARGVRVAAQGVTRRWSGEPHRLGVGVGVATGAVTVGVIGGAGRLEYTAVGPAVNLASRLCEAAADGEILVDAATIERSGRTEAANRPPLAIKGFATPVSHYSLY